MKQRFIITTIIILVFPLIIFAFYFYDSRKIKINDISYTLKEEDIIATIKTKQSIELTCFLDSQISKG